MKVAQKKRTEKNCCIKNTIYINMVGMHSIADTKPLNIIFSSSKALKETIKNDRNVFHWYLLFILNEQIRKKLEKGNDIKKQYKNLFFLLNLLFLISIPSLFSCFNILFFPQSLSARILICSLLFIYLFFKRQIKSTLLSIVNKFIDTDYKEHSFENLSLYQIGEFYASVYKTISLVEFLNKRLSFQAAALFSAFCYSTFIHPINLLTTFLNMVTALFILDIYFTIAHIWSLQFKQNTLPRSNK